MNSDIKERIKRAITAQTDKGITLVQHEWGAVRSVDGSWRATDDCACALGCLVLEEQPDFVAYTGPDLAAAFLLGATQEQIDSFVAGFDDGCVELTRLDKEWYAAGAELADELQPLEADAYLDARDDEDELPDTEPDPDVPVPYRLVA